MARPVRRFDPAIMRRATGDAFRKLDPRHMVRNPVMLVVEVGAVLTTIIWLRDLGSATGAENSFAGQVVLWLWFTVLFANFAEAMAEGRGKAQADSLRRTRTQTTANRRNSDGSIEVVAATALDLDDIVVVSAGEVIPSDGEVDRRGGLGRRVGHHRRVGTGDPGVRWRPFGGDWRHAGALGRVGGADHSPPRPDIPRPDDRLGRRCREAEDAQRDRPQHPARRANHHLPAGGGDPPAVRHLFGGRAGRSWCWWRCWSA